MLAYIKTILEKVCFDKILFEKELRKGLKELLPIWLQNERLYFIEAKSEANWAGMNQKEWTKQRQQRNRVEQNRFNLPS